MKNNKKQKEKTAQAVSSSGGLDERIFKFRSWIEPLKRMIYYSFSDYVEREYLLDENDSESNYVEPSIERAGTDYPESELKKHRMQFTGLYDKKHKEIYEGDLVEFVEGDIRKVYWDKYWVDFEVKQIPYVEPSFDADTAREIEVVGNIYENPELTRKDESMKHKKNPELKAESSNGQLDGVVRLPSIEIDKYALRFEFADGTKNNFFWDDLFVGQRVPNFQAEVMRKLHKAYIECIKKPDSEAT